MPIDCPGHADLVATKPRRKSVSELFARLHQDSTRMSAEMKSLETKLNAARQRHTTRRRLTLWGARV